MQHPHRQSYPLSTTKPLAVAAGVYCQKSAHSSVVSILDTNSYLLAEYNERNGNFSWQRLLAAPQKVKVEAWIRARFPVKAEPAPREVVKSKTASR